MKEKTKKVKKNKTIVDIANESGVSITTISRYFNDPSLVKERTRKKISKIVEKYHFLPSINTSKELSIIGGSYLLDMNMEHVASNNLMQGLLRGCQVYDVILSLYIAQDEKKTHNSEYLIRSRPKFVISSIVLTDENRKALCKNNILVGYLMRKDKVNTPFAKLDNEIVFYYDNYKIGDLFFELGLYVVTICNKKIKIPSTNMDYYFIQSKSKLLVKYNM